VSQIGRGFTLTWLGHSTFRLDTSGGRTVLMDPWVEGNPACPKPAQRFDRIDVMTISHGHGDHMADAVTLAKRLKPAIVCNYEIGQYLGRQGVSNVQPMNKGGTQQAAGLQFTMVQALHSSGIEDGDRVVYGGEPCGFVITLEDGTRLYHAGDTAVHSDMALIAELYQPEIALLPIGDLYTMSPREAAVAARLLKARWIVPMHYGTFPALTGTPAALREELSRAGVQAEVIAPEPGGVVS